MLYKELDERDPNFSLNRQVVKEGRAGGYVVRIQRSERALIEEREQLIANAEALYKQETAELPRIHFDRHLYQPLPVECGDTVRMTPPGLNKSEAQFVRDIKTYWH